MNCHAFGMTRREMLTRCGVGMGLARPHPAPGRRRAAHRRTRRPSTGEPARAEEAALPGEGEARHPPLRQRRAVAGRHVRPEAAARRSTPASRCRRQPPTERRTGAAFPSPFKFQKYGQTGIEVSELFAHTAKHIDDICVIRSMHADVPNHEPSFLLMNCGEAAADPAERRVVG